MSMRIIWIIMPIVAVLLPSRASAEGDKPIVTRSVAANRISSLPEYARPLSDAARDWGWEGGEPVDWLDVGINLRSRYELRDQDYRFSDLPSYDAFFTRSQVYLSVHDVLDPLRFTVEFQDSRRFFTGRPEIPNESNHNEILQAYAELWSDDLIPETVSVRFGRIAFDSADRRLLARNRYRNTISAFDGVRIRIGEDDSPLELDSFALRPVQRAIDTLDQSNDESWIYGATAYIRGNSPWLIVEPYWLLADQGGGSRKHIHTGGVHLFGQVPGTGWDHDWSFAAQGGSSAGLDHHAWSGHGELGYTWNHPWKPRFAAWLNYASGDGDPTDGVNERFDSLYGASFAFYGYTNYFIYQNMINPAVRLSFQPAKTVRCEVIHRLNWLASDVDAWPRSGRRDISGASGSYIGQELDLRASWQIQQNWELEGVFGHFFPGDFTQATGAAPDSNIGYVQATYHF